MKQFPGMNPYMEHPNNWRGFHNLIAGEIVAQLNSQILPAYIAQLEVYSVMQNVHIGGRSRAVPDIAVYEKDANADFVQPQLATISPPSMRVATLVEADTKGREILVYSAETRELVSAIEILSPANKTSSGLIQYRSKRDKLLRSDVHLIEIDLLRAGERVGEELDNSIDTDYLLLVNRANTDRYSDIWTIALNEPLPTIPIPLLYPDPDVPLVMMKAIETIYERYRYDLIPDYSQPPPSPQLRPAMKEWWREQFGEVV